MKELINTGKWQYFQKHGNHIVYQSRDKKTFMAANIEYSSLEECIAEITHAEGLDQLMKIALRKFTTEEKNQ